MGEYEDLNFSIGIFPEDIAIFHSLYRTSIKGRKDLLNAMFTSDGEGIIKMDRTYKSRVNEIFNVTLKSMGIQVEFVNEENEVPILSKTNVSEHELNGTTYICSDYQMFLIKRLAKIREEILLDNPVITKEDLDKLVNERLKKDKQIAYDYKDDLKKLKIDVEKENKLVYEKLQERKLKEETEEIAKSLEEVSTEVDIMNV